MHLTWLDNRNKKRRNTGEGSNVICGKPRTVLQDMPPDADVISPQALECFPQVRHWDFLSFLHTTENPPVFKLVIASFSIFLCLFSLMYIIQFFSFAVGLTHILGLLFFFFLTSPSCVCVCLFIIWQRDCLSICTYSLAFPWVFWEHSIT